MGSLRLPMTSDSLRTAVRHPQPMQRPRAIRPKHRPRVVTPPGSRKTTTIEGSSDPSESDLFFFPKDASQGYSKQEACVRGVRGVVYRNSAEFGPPSSELRKVIKE